VPGNAGLARNLLVGTEIPNVTSPYDHTGIGAGVDYYYVVLAYDTSTSLYSVASNELSSVPFGPQFTDGRIIW